MSLLEWFLERRSIRTSNYLNFSPHFLRRTEPDYDRYAYQNPVANREFAREYPREYPRDYVPPRSYPRDYVRDYAPVRGDYDRTRYAYRGGAAGDRDYYNDGGAQSYGGGGGGGGANRLNYDNRNFRPWDESYRYVLSSLYFIVRFALPNQSLHTHRVDVTLRRGLSSLCVCVFVFRECVRGERCLSSV